MTATYGLIGFGNMMRALYTGFSKNGKIAASDCRVVARSEATMQLAQREYGLAPASLDQIRNCRFIFCAVKPQDVTGIAMQAGPLPEGSVWISLAAGYSMSKLQEWLGKEAAITRLMPNTAVRVGQGFTAMACTSSVRTQDKAHVAGLLKSVGMVLPCEERHMNALTAIGGSGPAFWLQLSRDTMAFGKSVGISEEESRLAVAQSMAGAAELLKQENTDVAALIREITSPGGTTAAGLSEYQNQEIGNRFQAVLEAADRRAKELGDTLA